MALNAFPFQTVSTSRVVWNIFQYIGRFKRLFSRSTPLPPSTTAQRRTKKTLWIAVSHIKLWSKPIINAEWWWTLYSPAKPKCKSHQLNKEQRKREKKLMEKQTICTNDANTNENIYYFIHVWRATANKLWQNFMGENITAAVGAKQKCESTSFLCVFPKETV